MKVLVLVALFAFVAVQVCQSAPVPEDDKVELVDNKDAPAAPAAIAVAAEPVAESVAAEVKAEPASDTVAVTPADAPAEEEKKE